MSEMLTTIRLYQKLRDRVEKIIQLLDAQLDVAEIFAACVEDLGTVSAVLQLETMLRAAHNLDSTLADLNCQIGLLAYEEGAANERSY